MTILVLNILKAMEILSAFHSRVMKMRVVVMIYLINKGIILRPIANYGMPEFLRVSIGTEDEK